jgi:hypothetical protein
MTSSGRLWGRQANVNSPSSSNGPRITAGWHTLVRVWDAQQVRQWRSGVFRPRQRFQGALLWSRLPEHRVSQL